MNKTLKKVSHKLHLYLALLSGIVVFIVCITGCLYAFKDEINDFSQPWKFISPENKPMILPSGIIEISDNEINHQMPASAITYNEASDAVAVDYFNPETGMSTVYVNPYNGKVLQKITKTKDDFDFFRFILDGHRNLWLPKEIGKPIVAYGVLLFAITLITGIILWWPQRWNQRTLKRNFTLSLKSSFSKLNFDLHNVLGGYVAPVLLILSFTGLIFGLKWFNESVYFITSGGEKVKPYELPKSDTLDINAKLSNPLDQLYTQLRGEEPNAKTFYFALPSDKEGVIRVSVVHKRNSYYRTDNLFFDQYTLQPLQGSGPYAGKYTEATFADKFRRMNLEIHDGRILGLFGKILAFTASLIGASLPVTGTIIWLRKRKNRR